MWWLYSDNLGFHPYSVVVDGDLIKRYGPAELRFLALWPIRKKVRMSEKREERERLRRGRRK